MQNRFRQIRSRRQDRAIVVLIVLLSAAQTLALWTEARGSRRRQRQRPIAVALLQSADPRRPPTPKILPPSSATQTPDSKAAHRARARQKRQNKKSPPKKRAPLGKLRTAQSASDAPGSVPDKGSAQDSPDPLTKGPGKAQQAEAAHEKKPTSDEHKLASAGGGIRRCSARGPGAALDLRSSGRRAGSWLPVALVAAVRSRPRIDRYMSRAELLGRLGPRALATYRVALPADVIRFDLEQPRSASIYLGRTDVRCATVITLKGRPLRLKLRAVPVRLIDSARRVASAVVDLEIDAQARIHLTAREGDPLPFSGARLANPGAVSAAIAASSQLAGY